MVPALHGRAIRPVPLVPVDDLVSPAARPDVTRCVAGTRRDLLCRMPELPWRCRRFVSPQAFTTLLCLRPTITASKDVQRNLENPRKPSVYVGFLFKDIQVDPLTSGTLWGQH
jgi:hypothetical protein